MCVQLDVSGHVEWVVGMGGWDYTEWWLSDKNHDITSVAGKVAVTGYYNTNATFGDFKLFTMSC